MDHCTDLGLRHRVGVQCSRVAQLLCARNLRNDIKNQIQH